MFQICAISHFYKCLKKLTRNTYEIGRGSQLNERHQMR